MTAPFPGLELAELVRQVAPDLAWNRLYVWPEGDVTWLLGSPSGEVDTGDAPGALEDLFASIRAGRIRLIADVGVRVRPIPIELLRAGGFCLSDEEEEIEAAYLSAFDADDEGWAFYGPQYDRPRVVAVARPPAPDDADEPAYGAKAAEVLKAIADHATALAGIGTRRKRARWIADRIGCSQSYAEKILRREGK